MSMVKRERLGVTQTSKDGPDGSWSRRSFCIYPRETGEPEDEGVMEIDLRTLLLGEDAHDKEPLILEVLDAMAKDGLVERRIAGREVAFVFPVAAYTNGHGE